jgi:putative addiction module component (TIGR02574 family)
MTRDAEEILNAALKLNDKEKAAIVASLLESLDPLADDDVESAWQAEIQKRLHEIETGTVSLVPWSEVRKMLDLDE